MVYTMHIETAEGVRQHGFHLGTDFGVAKSIVLARLRDPKNRSIALRHGPELIKIYDYRDLEDVT